MGYTVFARTLIVAAACACAAASSVQAAQRVPSPAGARAVAQETHQAARPAAPRLDLSGRKRVGKASFYAKNFSGRKMADGRRMNPQGDNAASKTLPLGTTAKVTNLETGQSAVVIIQDRGPYVPGRIVDLSPSTAEKVGIDRQQGVAKVEVAPITVPQPDGSEKPGEAASEAKPAPVVRPAANPR
jgi:rare lipoprotein A